MVGKMVNQDAAQDAGSQTNSIRLSISGVISLPDDAEDASSKGALVTRSILVQI
jgi:hypothetical protein